MMHRPETAALIVAGYPILRHGLAVLLGGLPWLSICAATGDSKRARELCQTLRPKIIVLDMELEQADGISLIRDFQRLLPEVCTLVLSEKENISSMDRAFDAGASGYASKWDDPSEVQTALGHIVHTTERFISNRMTSLLINTHKHGRTASPVSGLSALSNREMEVFCLIGKGIGTSDTARSLGLSVKTVETHHQRIKQKLGLQNSEELKRYAFKGNPPGLLAGGRKGKSGKSQSRRTDSRRPRSA